MRIGNFILGLLVRAVDIEALMAKIIAYLTKQDDKVIYSLIKKAVDLAYAVEEKYGGQVPGEEKRKMVVEQLAKNVDNIADWLLNLINEIAVAIVKTKLLQKIS